MNKGWCLVEQQPMGKTAPRPEIPTSRRPPFVHLDVGAPASVHVVSRIVCADRAFVVFDRSHLSSHLLLVSIDSRVGNLVQGMGVRQYRLLLVAVTALAAGSILSIGGRFHSTGTTPTRPVIHPSRIDSGTRDILTSVQSPLLATVAAISTSAPVIQSSAPTTTAPDTRSNGKHPVAVDGPILEGIDPSDYGKYLPVRPITEKEKAVKSTVRCVNRGMQPKCVFTHFGVRANAFTFIGQGQSNYPNPIFPADGLKDPLWKHHKYRGHPIAEVGSNPCTHIVDRPALFLFRMSGHSTYHLWENNLGPFFSTLLDNFGLSGSEGKAFTESLNDPKQLIIVFVDKKPRHGPKAPHLLDQLLRTFTDLPLINASQIGLDASGAPSFHVCFKTAVVGVAASSFPHRELLYRMMKNIVGYSPPPPLPKEPNCLFISRNHHTVTRGRKIANEEEVVKALNDTIMKETGKPLVYAHMQDYHYREQVEMSMRTNIIFTPHGGGSANCIWMRKGSVIVEFVAPVGKTLLPMYRGMCGKSGVKHIGFLADADPADEKLTEKELNNNARLFSNMKIPVERMLENAMKALEAYRAAYKKASG